MTSTVLLTILIDSADLLKHLVSKGMWETNINLHRFKPECAETYPATTDTRMNSMLNAAYAAAYVISWI